MTDEALLGELAYEPALSANAPAASALVLGGMGGSAAAADALSFLGVDREILVHRGYDLPAHAPADALYIAVSYSGNTEETVSFAEAALAAGKPLAVVASGGTLAAFASEHDLPYASVPAGFAPRNALICMIRAILALIGERALLSQLAALRLDAAALHEDARQDALFFESGIPLFYSSERNALLGRIGKMVMNETARMPAFANTFPELNHNEMQSFDEDMPGALSGTFRFFLIEDAKDDPRVSKRMSVFRKLMEDEGRAMRTLRVPEDRAEALAAVWLRLLFAGRELAGANEVDPDAAPLVEKFKKLL